MPTRVAMKPWSPSPCTVGGSRRMDERTPREARDSVSSAVARRIRGPAARCSVPAIPCPSRYEPGRSGGYDERAVGVGERLAERLDRAAVGVGRVLEAAGERDVVLEREMDHAVRGGRRVPQGVDIVDGAVQHLGPGRGEGGGRGVRAGEPDDLMARADELGYDRGADPAGCAGDAHTHGNPPYDRLRLMSVAVISVPPDVSRCHHVPLGHESMGAQRAQPARAGGAEALRPARARWRSSL